MALGSMGPRPAYSCFWRAVRPVVSTVLVLCLLPSHGTVVSARQAPAAAADEITATYVFNFVGFVAWPSTVLGADTSALTICVPSNNRLAESLDRVVRGEAVDGRPLVVRRMAMPAEMKGCHVAALTGLRSGQVGRWLNAVRDAPVFTVGDTDEFLAAGGVLRFVETSGNRIGFDVNLESAARSGLQVSGRLLRLARRVYGP